MIGVAPRSALKSGTPAVAQIEVERVKVGDRGMEKPGAGVQGGVRRPG